jgi:NAD+ synthase (glutamine-hydrolysing)
MAQVAPRVGDVDGNTALILDAWQRASEAGADLVVFTELTVTGYPPEDLLLKPEFLAATDRALDELRTQGPAGTTAVIGTVAAVGDREDPEQLGWDVSVPALDLRNRAVVLADGEIAAVYDKWRLPNYGVFDEARYFVPDDDVCVVAVAGVPVGITICEDLWTDEGPLAQAAQAGARVVVNLNASPYHRGKRPSREEWVRHHATRDGTWIVYVNQVGGHDDVVFDGDSMLCSPDGDIVARGAQFAEDLVVVDLPVEAAGHDAERMSLPARQDAPRLEPAAEVWEALVLATGDYVRRNRFSDVIVALSGGLDSAVTAAIAADALGGDHVIGLLLPSPYSSDHSLTDARELATNMGIRTHEVPIGAAMQSFDDMLADVFTAEHGHTRPDDVHVSLTEENLQSRIRGVIVMALSNETGALVLTTGNKSEYAVGYATLYGDMAGGFAPLKDVPKTLVYELARHRAARSPSIPQNTIDKPPSAELKPGQVDQDSLPDYEVLDDIIEAYVEHNQGIADIVARGHDEAVVRKVLRMIDNAEFKRRQSAPGPKVTGRAFGKERRVPITHGWRG